MATTITNPISGITPSQLAQPFTAGVTRLLSGASVDFTSIPSWVTLINVAISQASFNATDGLILQIGDGSIKTSGYVGSTAALSITPVYTSSTNGLGLVIFGSFTSDLALDAEVVLKKVGTSDNWVLASKSAFSTVSIVGMSLVSKSLPGALDRVRLTSVSGSSSFDNGSASISWQ